MDQTNKELDFLRTTIKVLEQENAQLSERAEDAMLLGLVAEAIQGITDPMEVLQNVLERVSILKDYPFVTCARRVGSVVERICSYSLFTDDETVGYPIELSNEIEKEIAYGPYICNETGRLKTSFTGGRFTPSTIVLIPFTCHDFGQSLFILFDREGSSQEPGTSGIFLLDQIVNMTTRCLDNLFLTRQLDQLNASLEERIKQKTNDLQDSHKLVQAANERFGAVLDGLDAYIYVVDMESYEVLYVNRKFKEAFPLAQVGRQCYNVLKNHTYPCPECRIAELLDNMSIADYVVVSEAWDDLLGQWLLKREKVISWPNVSLAKLTIATDISGIKQAEEAREKMQQSLQQAQKMEAVGVLAGSVAHDLNNILSGIVSYPDLLLANLPDDSKLRQPLETIQTAGKKAAAIVRDLLTLARRGLKVEETVDLGTIVQEYVNSVECQALFRDNKNVTLHAQKNSKEYPLLGSSVHLSNILMNLVTNAVEAMSDDGGNVSIKLDIVPLTTQPEGFNDWRLGDYVKLTVSDTGMGIPKHLQQRIFEPFYSGKKLHNSGTGLGLAIVWGTVMDHKGFVVIESEEGKGTSFIVFLPCLGRESAVQQVPVIHDPVKGKGEKILVVDDVENQRQIASDILNHLGYSVALVESGERAVDYLKNSSADVVLLDMIMSPGIDGLETCKRILEIFPDQKIVIVSGFSQADRIEEVRRLGVTQYVSKPYSLLHISEAVDKSLSDYEAS